MTDRPAASAPTAAQLDALIDRAGKLTPAETERLRAGIQQLRRTAGGLQARTQQQAATIRRLQQVADRAASGPAALDPRAYAVRSQTLAAEIGRTLERHDIQVPLPVLLSVADTVIRAQAADAQRAEAAEAALDRVRELAVLIRYGAPWARNRGGLADRILDAATVRQPDNETAAEPPGPAATDSAT